MLSLLVLIIVLNQSGFRCKETNALATAPEVTTYVYSSSKLLQNIIVTLFVNIMDPHYYCDGGSSSLFLRHRTVAG